ncbi:ABC transporter substrate-binding protein [Natronobiforma cellulositropha]|uniref:ABC transporter substrate-binding protein n=1 Tax=Natronobiforma cellulositropha TaxID=1679076 RepID=UPI0021D5C2C7|nr:ABC transporter substrate-binding protein [Natronobiforma cellulositropha]
MVELHSSEQPSRRTFLRATGLAGTVGVVSLAGCTGNGDDDDVGAPDEAVVEDPDGEPVPELTYENLDPDAPLRYWYGQQHAENIRELGIEVDYNSRALDAHLERVFDTREFDYTVMRWLDGFDPDNALRTIASESTLTEGGGNVPGHVNEEYEEMLAEQRGLVDPDERQEVVFEMQEYLVEENVIHPIVVQDRAMPYRSDRVSNVSGMLEDGLAGIWNMVEVETDDGRLTAASHEDLTNLDPVTGLVSRANRDMIQLVYDRLMHPDPDEEYTPQPWAAESVEWEDDTTVLVTLRDGMEWHDGESVDADDVVFTFEYHEQENPDFGGLAENLETVEAETDLDVRFDLSEPDAIFESVILAGRNASLIPQHVWEGREPGEIVDEQDYVGSGPFQFESFDLGEDLRLSAHEGHHHEPNVDEFIRVESADASSSASLVQGGEVDMINFDLPADQLITLEDDDDIALESALMTSIHYGVPNRRREPFANPAIREAVAYTIPREDIVDIGADGFAEIIDATLSPGLEFWYNDTLDGRPFDIEAAIDVLADAGFQWNEDGQLHYPPEYEPQDEWADPHQPE